MFFQQDSGSVFRHYEVVKRHIYGVMALIG